MMVKYKLGHFSIDKYLDFHNLAFYLFLYHVVFSGVLSYLEYIGTIWVLPYRTLFFFGIPFVFFTIIYFARMVTSKYSIRFLLRNALFITIAIYLLVLILSHTGTFGFNTEVTSYNLTALSWYIISFVIGVNLHIKQSYKRLITFGYIVMVLNVLLNTDLPSLQITLPYDELGIFHFLGDGFAIWSFLMIAVHKNKFTSLVVTLVSTFCLYVLFSRTSLYAFLLMMPLVFKRNENGLLRLVFISVIMAGILFVVLNFESLVESRMLRFLFTGYDHSVYLREKILVQNSKDLVDNWFLGDYAGQLRHGVFGLYIHNYLSFWRQFGFIPFAIFIALLVPFFKWFVQWYRGKKYQEYDFLFYLTIFSLIEIAFTRSYKFHFIWFALGMMTHLIRRRKAVPDNTQMQKADE